jgi:hypothetical protein
VNSTIFTEPAGPEGDSLGLSLMRSTFEFGKIEA